MGGRRGKDAKKKAEAKVRRLQKDLAAVSEAIGNVEANKLLNHMDDAYVTTMQRLADEQQRVRAALAEIKLQLQTETSRQKWVSWLEAFGAEVKNTINFDDEQRKQYVAGIVERIDVRWLSERREHELTIHYRLPIVDESIQRLEPKDKSKGYSVVKEHRTDTLTLSQKHRQV